MMSRARNRLLIASAITTVVACLFAVPSSAASVTATLIISSGGAVGFTANPSNFSYTGVTLGGTDTTSVTGTLALDISDKTGSGAGWNVTATETNLATFACSSGSGYYLDQNVGGTQSSCPATAPVNATPTVASPS